jgi:hypothetical protein
MQHKPWWLRPLLMPVLRKPAQIVGAKSGITQVVDVCAKHHGIVSKDFFDWFTVRQDISNLRGGMQERSTDQHMTAEQTAQPAVQNCTGHHQNTAHAWRCRIVAGDTLARSLWLKPANQLTYSHHNHGFANSDLEIDDNTFHLQPCQRQVHMPSRKTYRSWGMRARLECGYGSHGQSLP